MGCCRFHRRVCVDEAVRGESYSRRHPQACLQNTSDEASDIRVVDICRDAFGVGLVAGAEAGLSARADSVISPHKSRRSRSRRVR